MAIEEMFDLYEKAARWRTMADRITYEQAAAALRKMAFEIERQATQVNISADDLLAEAPKHW